MEDFSNHGERSGSKIGPMKRSRLCLATRRCVTRGKLGRILRNLARNRIGSSDGKLLGDLLI